MKGQNRALVLTGGGARGAYQAGVIKYIGENIPEAHFETLIGSSSGAINVAGIASSGGDLKEAGTRIADLWSELHMQQVFRTDAISLARIGTQWLYDLLLGGVLGRPLAGSLLDTSPLRTLLEHVYQADRVQKALHDGSLHNVAVSATEVFSGSLVTFIQSARPRSWHRARRRGVPTQLTVDHVMASAAIPFLFPAVLVGNRQYVDGCIRSTSPLGPAARLGVDKILAVGVRRYYMQETGNLFESVPTEPERIPSPADLGALVLNSLFAEALDADIEHLERLNAMVPAAQEGSLGMRKIDIMAIRPSEDLGMLAKKYKAEMPLLVRFLLRGLGSERGDSADILSYLLFQPEYLNALVELGYHDARAEDNRLRHFFRS